MKKTLWTTLLIIFIGIAVGMFYRPAASHEMTEEISHEHAEEFQRGPHHGRLLQKDQFQVEVTIFEPESVPPKFRIYFYDHNKPVNPSEVEFHMELQRINRTENIPFKQVGEFLESAVEASEPHSFKVNILASYKGRTYEWEYESYEGRVELTPEAIQANKIKIETAGPIHLEIKLDVMGKIMPDEDLTVHISPRFPGVVKAVNKKLGDEVRKGDVLAVIESNESLRSYEIKSETNGMVIKKDVNLGMSLSGQEIIYVISDLSSVWADFNIYRRDLPQIKVGDLVEISSLDISINQSAKITYVSPIGNERTQSVIARAVLSNPDLAWRPGLFVTGEITIDDVFIPVAVKQSALQTFRNWNVVFIAVGDTFEVVPVELGRSNREWVEIKSGLSAGDRYVSENSYIIKADLEKSGATHDH